MEVELCVSGSKLEILIISQHFKRLESKHIFTSDITKKKDERTFFQEAEIKRIKAKESKH